MYYIGFMLSSIEEPLNNKNVDKKVIILENKTKNKIRKSMSCPDDKRICFFFF